MSKIRFQPVDLLPPACALPSAPSLLISTTKLRHKIPDAKNQPFGLFTLGEINLQGFRYAPSPDCNLNPLRGLCCFDVWRRKDFDVWSRTVDGWSGALCAVPMWDVGSTSSFITSLLAEGDHFHRPTSSFRLQKHFLLQEWFFILNFNF